MKWEYYNLREGEIGRVEGLQSFVLLHLFSKSKLVETRSANGISPTNDIKSAQ